VNVFHRGHHKQKVRCIADEGGSSDDEGGDGEEAAAEFGRLVERAGAAQVRPTQSGPVSQHAHQLTSHAALPSCVMPITGWWAPQRLSALQGDSSEDEGMDDEAMARLEGGLAAAVQAAAASKPNSKERKQQMLNFKLRCAAYHCRHTSRLVLAPGGVQSL
jgi:DNA polymerase phi